MIKNKQAVIVSPNFYPAIGGAETQAYLIGQWLLKNGYNVSVITQKYYPDSVDLENYKQMEINRFSGNLLKIIPRLFQTYSKDLIIWNGLFKRDSSTQIIIQAFICGISKLIFKKTVFRVPCVTQPILENVLVKTLFRYSIDKWLTLNRAQYTYLSSRGITKNRLIAPPNLIISSKLFLEKRQRRSSKKLTIFFCGRTIDLKGIKTLVDSLSLLPGKTFELVMLLSLPIKYPQECQRNLKLLNGISIPFKVKFDEPNITPFLLDADIGVFPSSSEGGGNILREMMATGVATVSSNIPTVQEVITDQKDGFLFQTGNPKDLASKISALVENPALRKSIGINARNKAREIGNPEVIISKILG